MKYAILIILLSFPSFNDTEPPVIEKIWQISKGLEFPESVVYDKENNVLYVSNYKRFVRNGSSYADCSISKVGLNGQIIDKNWIPNLSSPTGLFLKDGLLYIVERFGIAIYDIKNDKMKARHRIKHNFLINDITVDNENNMYVTEAGNNTLYRIKENKVTSWIKSDSIGDANGISFIDDKIYIGVNKDGFLKSIDTKTKQISNVYHLGKGNIDGIKKRGNQLLISLYEKGMRLIDENGEIIEFANTASTGLHCADFEYIPHKDMIIVPSLFDNTLTAYKFKD
ncbi:hypothetical protein BKI52_30195 [marine bacterium AO1-C]|nr:hypothetical protein BKI52_30195 [marine bacterium AO1-C]